MRTSKFWLFLTLCGIVAAVPAQAQSGQDTPPPTLKKLEEGNAPDITIRPSDNGSKTTETREQGVVTDIHVKSGKSNYHLKQGAGPGNVVPGDALSTTLRPAQWQFKEFDWGVKQKKDVQADDLQTPAAPPPPPPPARTRK